MEKREPFTGTAEAFAKMSGLPLGEPNEAFGRYFTGQSYLALLAKDEYSVFNITFEPGCRSVWHVHRAGNGGGHLLICTAGKGLYCEWGREPVEMLPGTVIRTEAGVKHWHGAAAGSWFSHIAVELPGEETGVEWLEPVEDKEYLAAQK